MDSLAGVLERVGTEGAGLRPARTGAMVKPLSPTVQMTNPICKPDCLVCGGIGYVRQDVPISDPRFGKLTTCPNADVARLYKKNSGLDDGDDDLSWESIMRRHNVQAAIDAVKDVLATGYGWVFLWGEYGLAKSLILRTAVVEALRMVRPAAYTRMADVIENLRSAYDAQDPSVEAQKRLDGWADVPVLAIDEFDRLRNTEFVSEKRFALMDRRYESAVRYKTITLMASNADPNKCEGYLYDRIMDGRFKVVHLLGKSARPLMG